MASEEHGDRVDAQDPQAEPSDLPLQRSGDAPANPVMPPAGPADAPAPAPTPPRRNRGRILLVAAIVLACLVAAGGVTGLLLYDKATAIDRSTPVISADGFLNAVAVESDLARAALYTCSRWSASDALAETKRLVDPEARTTWDSFAVVSQTGSEALVEVRMRFRYPGEVAPSGEKVWQLNLVDERGWRVCSVRELS